MKIALLAALAAFVLCFLFLCTGSIIQKMRGKRDFSLSGALLLGYVVYFSLFEVICLASQPEEPDQSPWMAAGCRNRADAGGLLLRIDLYRRFGGFRLLCRNGLDSPLHQHHRTL